MKHRKQNHQQRLRQQSLSFDIAAAEQKTGTNDDFIRMVHFIYPEEGKKPKRVSGDKDKPWIQFRRGTKDINSALFHQY